MFVFGLIAATASLVLLMFSDVFSKTVSRVFGAYVSSLYLGIAVLPMAVYVFISPPLTITWTMIGISAISGLALAAGYVLVLKSLETEQASNTWALINIPYLAIVIFGVLSLLEPITWMQIIATIAIFIGSGLVTINKDLKFNKLLLPAIAGVSFWIIYNLLSIYEITEYSSSSSAVIFSIWLIGFLSLLVYGVFSSRTKSSEFKKLMKSKLDRPIVAFLFCGLAMGLGQIAFVVVVLQQFVALGGAVLAIEPALVVVLAYLVYKEKMTTPQKTGVIISVIGALALSLL